MGNAPQRRKSIIDIEKLRVAKATYTRFVLCDQEDLYKRLFSENVTSVVGPKGSNLLAIVRISTAGAKAVRYRTYANKVITANSELQKEIKTNHVDEGDEFVSNGRNNPFIKHANGTVTKLCWHHSPNHIASISLIPVSIHNRRLHVNGMGGRRYEVPDLSRREGRMKPGEH